MIGELRLYARREGDDNPHPLQARGCRRTTAHCPCPVHQYPETRTQARAGLPQQTRAESSEPRCSPAYVSAADADLSRWNGGEAEGEPIIVTGRVLDEDGQPIRGTLIELWQTNAAMTSTSMTSLSIPISVRSDG